MSAFSPSKPRLVQPPVRRARAPERRKISFSYILIHAVLLLLSISFLLPLLLIVSGSFSDNQDLLKNGYALWPHRFSLQAYQFVLSDPSQILTSYGVTIIVTLSGTALGLLVMSLVAYALVRRDFVLRRWVAFYIFFTMLFSGGLVPLYILVTQYLHIQDTLLVLIYPGLMVPWYVLLLRTYFASLPGELIDAARIDGASEWRILFQLVMPLSRAALATVALFSMLGYWNDWYQALLFINDEHLMPLQFLLYRIATDSNLISKYATYATSSPPTLSAQMAMAVIAIGPIVFAFLFLQRYFIRGITLGGLKGD